MFFKKKKPDDAAAKGASDAAAVAEQPDKDAAMNQPSRDPRKARRFFEHAQTMADSRNYDYAIELYINGLRQDPDNMDKHEALREVALRRKVGGGKPPKFTEKFKSKTKDKIDRFLNEEALWSKDPLNLQRMLSVMEFAVQADDGQEEFNFGEVVLWIGTLILDKQETDRPPKKDEYVKLCDQFMAIGRYDKAIEAARRALEIDPSDTDLENMMKDLDAELAMQKGGYSAETAEEVDFKKSIRNKDEQDKLAIEDQLSKSEQQINELIERTKLAFEQNPDDEAGREKYVRALLEKEDEQNEATAIKLLEEAHTRTGNYKHRMLIGNIQIRQFDRKLKQLKARAAGNPQDAEAIQQYKETNKQKVRHEYSEFTARIKQYPTDMKWRFELGRLLISVKQPDKAIEHLQLAVKDPKFRATGSLLLGKCYIAQDWYDEAIDTFKRGLESQKDLGDKGAMETRYCLMTALEHAANKEQSLEKAREAMKLASEMLQTDVNYRDIRQRSEQLRQLVKKLQGS